MISIQLLFFGMNSCYELARKVYPYSIVRKERLGIMIGFIESRLGKSSHEPYTQEELALNEKMKSLNHRGL